MTREQKRRLGAYLAVFLLVALTGFGTFSCSAHAQTVITGQVPPSVAVPQQSYPCIQYSATDPCLPLDKNDHQMESITAPLHDPCPEGQSLVFMPVTPQVDKSTVIADFVCGVPPLTDDEILELRLMLKEREAEKEWRKDHCHPSGIFGHDSCIGW